MEQMSTFLQRRDIFGKVYLSLPSFPTIDCKDGGIFFLASWGIVFRISSKQRRI